MKKKCLAVGIILLFIGVAVAPSINFNVVKASNDNDLVEVTSQACGIKGYGNTTVKLTTEQYQNLEQYLVDFRARLNQTTTREEAVPIFKDAVVELNKYGLLPKGMSVNQAQKLITGQYQKVQPLNIKAKKDKLFNSPMNLMCLVFGVAPCTFSSLLLNLASSFYEEVDSHWYPPPIILGIAFLTMYFLSLYDNYFPLSLLQTLTFENSTHGWVITAGLLGIQHRASNDLSGHIYGFTGIKLWVQKDCQFIGFALKSDLPY